jgi:capsule biosynthesis phosphatase
MIRKEKCIVIDVDGTLTPAKKPGESYADLQPYPAIRDALHTYRDNGFYIIVNTSRNMRSYEGNMGLILANTAPVLLDWLNRHKIPYDEVHFGKPWPGVDGFCIDDRAVRPTEFLKLTLEEIRTLLENEKIGFTT